MPYQERAYRRWIATDLHTFRVSVGESDLMISAERPLAKSAERALRSVRRELQEYLTKDPDFGKALKPHRARAGAPEIVVQMAAAAEICVVGPMAAVAGAVAEAVGRALLKESKQVIVENGGDVFLCSAEPRVAAIYAGASPLSGKIGVRIMSTDHPLGLCTSSGTVGHSLSFGKADAAIVLAESAALADAGATALGNRIQSADDIEASLAWLKGVDGVLGGAIVLGRHIGGWGQIELVRMADGGTPPTDAPE